MVREIPKTVQKTTKHLVRLALVEDLADRGDVTSQAILSSEATLCGQILAKAPGVVAGLFAVHAVYRELDPAFEIVVHLQDGAPVAPGELICAVVGKGQRVLAGERTALNFLQRLSGVATLTAQFVAQVAHTNVVILDTRKTTPGWRVLEKYAVTLGGGQNHRMGLYDAVMIKGNHIDMAGGITAAVSAVLGFPGAQGLPIVVEVRNRVELEEAIAAQVDQIMLDNMTDAQIRDAVNLVAGRVPLEASGNMSIERVRGVAETGVDYISVGALTHSAPALDLSMRLSAES